MAATKVGIREFRENLSTYLESKSPVAITRHGSTLGVYIPTKPEPEIADWEAFHAAGERLQKWMAAAGTSEEKLMKEFEKMHRKRKMSKKPHARP